MRVLARVRASPKMDGLDLVPRVTCRRALRVERADVARARRRPRDRRRAPIAHHVVAYDFGIKENILRQLRDIGCRVTVVPATTPARDALALGADGFFLSNGPGDPAAVDVRRRGDQGADRERQAGVRHLPRPPDPRPRARRAHAQAAVRPPRRQPPGARQDHRQGRDHVAEPRLRRRSETTLPSGVHVTHENLFDHCERGHRGRGQADLQRAVPPRGEPGPARRELPVRAVPRPCSRRAGDDRARRPRSSTRSSRSSTRGTPPTRRRPRPRAASTRSAAARSTRTTSCGRRGARRSSSGSSSSASRRATPCRRPR